MDVKRGAAISPPPKPEAAIPLSKQEALPFVHRFCYEKRHQHINCLSTEDACRTIRVWVYGDASEDLTVDSLDATWNAIFFL